MSNVCRVLFVTTGKYPIPATEGGAVENLMEMMLQNHRDSGDTTVIDIISTSSEKATIKAREYPNIGFYHVTKGFFEVKVYPLIKKVFLKFWGIEPVYFYPFFLKAIRRARKSKYDCVIVENKPQFVPGFKRFCESKIILHLHNDTLNSRIKGAQTMIHSADCVITVSNYINKCVQEINDCKTPVITVYNVIDNDLFHVQDDSAEKIEIRNKYEIPENDVLFVFSGRLIQEKGVDLLIDAFQQMNMPNVTLMIVGGDAFADSVETSFIRRIKTHAQANKRVVFTGYVPYGNMPSYYRAADIAVFPSQWDEPAGLVSIEAELCGLPVIITEAGGMPEYVSADSAIIVKRGASFVKDLAKAMEVLASDADKRSVMGRAAVKTASRFDKAGYISRILNAALECKDADKQNG